MMEKTLYERLGGVFAIAAVVDHFSDAIVKNPIVGQHSKKPALAEWHTEQLGRLISGERRNAYHRSGPADLLCGGAHWPGLVGVLPRDHVVKRHYVGV